MHPSYADKLVCTMFVATERSEKRRSSQSTEARARERLGGTAGIERHPHHVENNKGGLCPFLTVLLYCPTEARIFAALASASLISYSRVRSGGHELHTRLVAVLCLGILHLLVSRHGDFARDIDCADPTLGLRRGGSGHHIRAALTRAARRDERVSHWCGGERAGGRGPCGRREMWHLGRDPEGVLGVLDNLDVLDEAQRDLGDVAVPFLASVRELEGLAANELAVELLLAHRQHATLGWARCGLGAFRDGTGLEHELNVLLLGL